MNYDIYDEIAISYCENCKENVLLYSDLKDIQSDFEYFCVKCNSKINNKIEFKSCFELEKLGFKIKNMKSNCDDCVQKNSCSLK